MNKPSYNLSADLLRVVAISGVVLIHTANAVYARPDFFGGLSWWIAILLNSISRISIPLFIMISGYFILQKQESFIQTLKRTWLRLIFPFLFWWTIYIIAIKAGPYNFTLLKRLLTVNVFDLYFFIILIGLYLISPVLRYFFQKTSEKEQKQFFLFTLAGSVIIFLCQYLFSFCSPSDSFTYWVPYVGIFVAGYYLGRQKQPASFWWKITYGVGLLVTLAGSYFYFLLHNQGISLLDSHGCLSYYTDSYLSVNVVLMTLSIFVLFIHKGFSLPQKLASLVYSVARASLGIYVLHSLFLLVLDSHFHIFDHVAPAWLYVVIKWTVIFGLSYLATAVLIKIPLIKRVFGEVK